MSNDEINRYLPTEETQRRVADRAASDENMRRALEDPRVRAAMELPDEGAASAARRPVPRRSTPRRRWRRGTWPLWRQALAACLAVSAPAAVLYWLFVVPGGAVAPEQAPAPATSASAIAAPPPTPSAVAIPPPATPSGSSAGLTTAGTTTTNTNDDAPNPSPAKASPPKQGFPSTRPSETVAPEAPRAPAEQRPPIKPLPGGNKAEF